MSDSTHKTPTIGSSNGMRRLKQWAHDNGFGLTTAYKKINSGEIRARKVGRLTYVTDEADAEWKASLPDYKPASGQQA